MNQFIDKSDEQSSPVILYRLILAYNGSGFCGWQSQSNGSGIQDCLEKALLVVFREPLRVTSSSRTDTGVHADFQVVTFRTTKSMDLHKILRALNALLPRAVKVRDVQIAEPDFHPIHSANAKVYLYRIWRSAGESPLIMPTVWHLTKKLNVLDMIEASKVLIGTHDFTSFCASDSSAKTKVRNVIDIQIKERGPLLEIWVQGEGFLKQMVRAIVGSLVSVGDGRLTSVGLKAALDAKDRKQGPATAPAQGLTLAYVHYDEIKNIEELLRDHEKMYNIPLWGPWFDF